MIARISGKITERRTNQLFIDVGGITYEVWVPFTVMERLKDDKLPEGKATLITYHYYQIEPSRGNPVLIGFLSELEKEFFQKIITVAGIGPRAALRALNKPISQIAQAIDEGDVNFLISLPGIGAQRAREVIAKLQGKVGRFCLVRDREIIKTEARKKDIASEAMAVLLQLQYKKNDAQKMINLALERCPNLETCEELLNEIYRERQRSFRK